MKKVKPRKRPIHNIYCRGAMNNKGYFSPFSRRGLLAYVYSGVFE